MKKTILCHFYNEEYMLPWFLNHHKQIFDHGIMIDYNSEDRSRDIIHEICPTWDIHMSQNWWFDSTICDEEVMKWEKTVEGWRMALNVTEFLYGNTDHLPDDSGYAQYFIGNYVFVDMQNQLQTQGELPILSHDRPLHEQRLWGYDEFQNKGISFKVNL